MSGLYSIKSKAFLRYYLILAVLLAGGAAIPIGNFAVMVYSFFYRNPFFPQLEYNVVAVIPFMAVTVAILAGFLLTPLLKNLTLRKKQIFGSAVAALLFFVLEWMAEMVASRLMIFDRVLNSRAMFSPYATSALTRWRYSPLSVRVHYYIFSVILVLSVLNWLYNLTETLYGEGKPGKKFVIVQGMITLCYALAYVFVRVMKYDDYATMLLTRASVLNVAVCFTLAALVVGVSAGSFPLFSKRSRIIPPLLSIATVLALYGAEYSLLGGDFYSYTENAATTILLQILMIGVPGIAVYVLLKAMQKSK